MVWFYILVLPFMIFAGIDHLREVETYQKQRRALKRVLRLHRKKIRYIEDYRNKTA